MTYAQLLEILFANVPEMKEFSKQFYDILGDGSDTEEAMWLFGVMPAVRYMLREDEVPELLCSMFWMFEQMFSVDGHQDRCFFTQATMYHLSGSKETMQKARKLMHPTTRRTFDKFIATNRTDVQWTLALLHSDEELYKIEENEEVWRPAQSFIRGFRARKFHTNQHAPIEPYVGAGGLKFGWTKEQVEKITGPLGESVAIEYEWQRYAVGDQMWLYFSDYGEYCLDKIVTLPGYSGRLLNCLDTNTPVDELSWREPSLIWNQSLNAYVSEKGVMIKPVGGRCGHIIIFNEKWRLFVE